MKDTLLINEVREVMRGYGERWDEWLNSADCFLDDGEIRAMGYLLAVLDLEKAAAYCETPAAEFADVLRKGVEKLRLRQGEYEQWLRCETN